MAILTVLQHLLLRLPVVYFIRSVYFTENSGYRSLKNRSCVTVFGSCSATLTVGELSRKEFDWNGDVATRVDMRTTKVKFFKKYLCEGMSDPGKIIRPGR